MSEEVREEEELREEPAESRSISFEYDLPEPVEKVWRALSTPEVLSEWLLPIDPSAEQGRPSRSREEAKEPIECEVISIEHERSIRFGWRDEQARRDGLDSTVTFEVEGTTSGGTHLRIVHEVHYLRSKPLPATACLAANDNGAIGLRMAA